MALEVIDYTPPLTIDYFMSDYRPGELFYSWIVGPYGSGKTTGIFFKLVYMAGLQAPGPDGIRRTRAVVVRNTRPQLKDTTIKSWNMWFKEGVAGSWQLTEQNFFLKFGDIECEVMFRPLDTAEDVDRVLSLEVTFALIDEFVQIPKAIVEALSGRCGRYPSKKDGGATNFGMWGSSNPSTEDNWWFDYLHGRTDAVVEQIKLYGTYQQVERVKKILSKPMEGGNIRYFHQPSGTSPEAENVENMSGGRTYYTNLAIGKSQSWIKQFIDAEWGFSASETPVIVSFLPNTHVARMPLIFNPAYPLIGGFDPGLAGTALVLGQEDMHGRLIILGEIGAINIGVSRFLSEKVKPYLRANFSGAEVIIAPDPASANRAQTDERAVVDIIRKHFQVRIETNNHLAVRLEAIESYTTRLTEMGPALLIDRDMCPNVVRALSGGWRYGKTPKVDHMKPTPEKNALSHWGDATGYLARYFHKQYDRSGTRGRLVGERRSFPAPARPLYHIR